MSATQQARLSTRLIAATWRADAEAVRALITRGADVNAKDDTEQSAYLVTTSEGYPRLLDLMLCHGADVSSLDSYHGTGLIRAAERGHADVVGRLLRTPIAVDHVNNLGWTALHEAVILGDGSTRYVDTVRALVAGGADIGIPAREDGMTALQHARAAGQHAVAGVLRAPAASDERNRARAAPAAADHLLLRAAGAGDASAVAVALRQGARLEARDGKGRTALLRAALRDRVDVARLLVALGADPNAQDARRDSAWLVTGVTGSVPMLETLLPADPDLSLTNRFGGVSLIPASERGHVSYVRRVVQTGIDVNHVNDLGWTALLEAVILGDGSRPYQQVVRTLLDAGADPTLADGAGVTPEQHARDQGQDEVARIIRLASRDRTGRR